MCVLGKIIKIMSKKFAKFDYNKSVSVQNIKDDIDERDVEEFFLRFGRFTKIIIKKNNYNIGKYAIIEYHNEDAAQAAFTEMSGKYLANIKLKVGRLQEKKNLFEHKQEFYQRIRKNIDGILALAQTRISNIYQDENISIKPKFDVPSTTNLDKSLNGTDLYEYLEKKVAETAPELRSKCKRMLKKLAINKLYTLYTQEDAFTQFINALKTND